jgi:iron complex transport system substrate-binding protein
MACGAMPRFDQLPAFRAIAAVALVAALGTLAGATLRQPRARQPVAHRPQRIVSLNLCADQYLLALADRSQIAGLSPNVADPELSAAAAQAVGLHIMGESAEGILAMEPDLLVDTPGGPSEAATALSGRRYRTLELPPAESYAEIVAQIRQVAAAIGQVPRGEALIARMNRDLAGLPRRSDRPVAAYYQRRGYLTGTGTLIDDLMHRLGLRNLAGKLGKPALAQLSLEELIAARPDYLIVESNADHVVDQGTEMLHHPVLDGIPRLRLPQSWTVCGGPAYVLAAHSLAQQLARANATQTRAARIGVR